MRARTSFVVSLATLVFAGGLTGCPGPGAGQGIQRVDQSSLVEVITSDDAKVLDPHSTSDGGNVKLINQLYQTLVRVDPQDTSKLIPELAVKWEVAEDARQITFTIREGVEFHDGAALDAAAVKLSLDRLRERGFELRTSPYGFMFNEISELVAEGSQLTMKLSAPVAPVLLKSLSMFSASVVSPKLLAATMDMKPEEAETHVTKNAAGTGPYRLDAFDPAAAAGVGGR